MSKRRSSIGIVGGGMLGMTLSLRLAESGLDVTLVEGDLNPGGAASSCRIGDYIWDQFYHVILLSDSQLLSLIDQLGLKDELHWGQTKTGFYVDGRLHSISNFYEFLSFPPLNILDKLRLGLTILCATRIKDWRRLEDISSADWLRKYSGRRAFAKIWLPLLKSKLGDDYALVNASFIRATISRMYAARRTELKKEMFGYVTGGYGTIIDRLRRALEDKGVNILTQTRVTSVVDEGTRVSIEIGKGNTLRFDRAVLTVPCPEVLRLCPQLTRTEVSRLKSVLYQDLLCAAFLLKGSLSDYYITNIAEGDVPFTGIIEMTTLVNKENFGGHSLVYLPRYLAKSAPFFKETDDTVKETFLASLKGMYPAMRADDLVAWRISRIPDFPVVPTLRYYKTSLPPTPTSMRNVFLVNSAQILDGTNNVNEIVALANRKAADLTSFFDDAETLRASFTISSGT